jgi:PAS domain S-box-containing protein
MPEMNPIAPTELESCQERARKLAMEKSYLQLVNHLMLSLGEVTGVESVVDTILKLLLDNLGGSNVALYYWLEAELYYADVYGTQTTITRIDDEIVQRALTNHEFIEVEDDFEQTRMLTPAFTRASTWAAPLLVGTDLVGVLKLTDMLMAATEIRHQLEPFFRYSALVLRNEISGYAKLNRAYGELRETNARLSAEIRVREHTEERLIQEREFSRSLLESMADGVVACDAEGTLTLFNRTAREWHGLDPMKLPAAEWAHYYDLYRMDGVTPLPTEEVPLVMAFTDKMVVDAGMAIVAKGQSPRFILANGSVIKDAGGKKLGAVVIMRDITRLRGVEQELRRAKESLESAVAQRTVELKTTLAHLQVEFNERQQVEEKLQITQFSVDTAADAIFWIRADGSYAYANKAACDLLGYSNPEFSQLKTFDLNPVHQGPAWLAHWQQLKGQGSLRFETVLLGKDGSWVPVEITASYVEFHQQEYNCAFARDISARLRSEEESRRSAREWSAAMDASEDVIYLLDLDRRLLRANKAFYRTTQSTAESAVGSPVAGLMHPGGAKVPCQLCQAQVEQRELVFTMEPDHPHNPAGLPFEIVLNMVRDDVGKPLSMLMTWHDLSHERTVQAELAAYRENLEALVATRTAEIEKKKAEVERLNRLFVGRELRMIELKQSIKALEELLEEGGR